MKHSVNLMGVSAATILFGAVLVSAQGPGTPKGMRMCNPATETTLNGTIEAVTEGARGQMMGTHLTLKTAEGVRRVVLCPMGGSEYIVARSGGQGRQDFDFT